jgi:alkylation response protein AidB-like acyl-CoA dehydrogenase
VATFSGPAIRESGEEEEVEVDFGHGRDEEIAGRLRKFLEVNLPEAMRQARFDWAFDWDFHQAFIAWQNANLAEASDATIETFVDELFWADLDLRASGTTALVSNILLAVGTDAQRNDLVPKFLRGEALAALGYTEPDSGSDVAAAKTRAVRDGDEWVINGQKMYTSNAQVATHVFLLTRTNTEVPKHKGLTTFIVPLDTPGVEVRPIQTLRGHPTTMTYYTDVRVSDRARVGDVDAGWSVMRVALDMEHGAGPIGVETRLAQAVSYGARLKHLLDRTVAWAATTERPDGSRLLDDPAVRKCLARIAVDNEIHRLLAGRNDPASLEPGVGNGVKLFTTEAYLRATGEILDLAGPAGLLNFRDPDAPAAGWLEYSFRDAPVATIAGGSSEVQRDVIAERRLGLSTTRTAGRGRSDS